MKIDNQTLKDWEPTFGRKLRESDKQQVQDVLLGVVGGLAFLLFCYVSLLMINALDNAYQSHEARQMLIQSELNYKTN